MKDRDNKGPGNNGMIQIDIRQVLVQLGLSEDKWQEEMQQMVSVSVTDPHQDSDPADENT